MIYKMFSLMLSARKDTHFSHYLELILSERW